MSTPSLLAHAPLEQHLNAFGVVISSTTEPQYVAGPLTGTYGLTITPSRPLQLEYTEALDFVNTAAFSVGGWFLLDSDSGSAFTITGNPQLAYFVNEVVPFLTLQPSIDTMWTHIWFTASEQLFKCYVNGVLRGSVQIVDTTSGVQQTGWSIGHRAEYTGTATLSVSDLRWYNGEVLPESALAFSVSLQSSNMDNAVNLIVGGGVGGYTYLWAKDGASGYATTRDLSDLFPGVFTCTVTSGDETLSVTKAVLLESDAVVLATATTAKISYPAVPEAVSYLIEYLASGWSSPLSRTTKSIGVIISDLTPGTTYIFTVTSVPKIGPAFVSYISSVTTPVNTDTAGYSKEALILGTAPLDIDLIKQTGQVSREAILNAILASGDEVRVSVAGRKLEAIFRPLNSNVLIQSGRVFVASNDTDTEVIKLQLADDSVRNITYDTALDIVNINGVPYSPGRRISIEGKRLVIFKVN